MNGYVQSKECGLPTDEEITSLFFSRNEDAIMQTEKKYGKLFRSISLGITGDAEDAMECVNDAYLKMWSSIPPERPQSIKAYGGRIVRNLSINRAEREGAMKRGGGAILAELDESIPDPSDGDCRELASMIDSFLRGIDRESRVMFVLRYWYCMALEDVAKKTGKTVQTVKSRLFRTRNKLKGYLEKEGITL